jgi:DNA-binding GntR family transcriptional regulator
MMSKRSENSLSDMAYIAIKKKIITLGSGSYISARQFANEIGVSYTPVREAFLRLEREGTLKLIPNVGFFINTFDIGQVIQIYQVRECTELFVLEKGFDGITSEHIQRMNEINTKLEAALAKGNILEYQQLDIKFHEAFFIIYGNKHLLNFYRNIREQYMLCSIHVAKRLSNTVVIEHNEILASIEAGDKEKAINALRKNISQARERMIEGYINVSNDFSAEVVPAA